MPPVFDKVEKDVSENKIRNNNSIYGGLNEKEAELNLCSIFFILTFNGFYLFVKWFWIA